MDNFDSNTNNRFDFLQGLEMSDWIKKMLKDNFIEELGIELVNYDHNKIKLKNAIIFNVFFILILSLRSRKIFDYIFNDLQIVT